MIRAGRWFGLVALVAAVSAHVGSPNVYFEGTAGPYGVRVIVRAAPVVPGQADITVRVLSGGRPRAVTVLPVYWDPRTAAPPPADTARPIAGDSLLYSAQLWLMTAGSYAVQVSVTGAAGGGTVNVPVQAVATRRLEMARGMAWGLGAVAAFLVIGLVTIARAAARESTVAPGDVPGARNRRHGWIATGIATAWIGTGLFLGRGWWNGVDQAYARTLYRPTAAHTRVTRDGMLEVRLADPVRDRRWTPLIPDHGHLMHLFLVQADFNGFAHLHPAPQDSTTFTTALPALPAGRYRVFADLVHESGFTETVTDTVTVPASRGASGDPDDGAWLGKGADPSATSASLADGSSMTWDREAEPIVAGADAPLRFHVTGPRGQPARLEPYLGMIGHAVVARSDGGVFVHLHPMGTISWTAQETFSLRTLADTLAGSLTRKLAASAAESREHLMTGDSVAVLSFPYAFPSPGRYRIWVQVKRNNRVLTFSFTTDVGGAGGR